MNSHIVRNGNTDTWINVACFLVVAKTLPHKLNNTSLPFCLFQGEVVNARKR